MQSSSSIHLHSHEKASYGEPMNDSVIVVVDNQNRSTRAIHLSAVTRKQEKQASLLLLNKRVYLANRGSINNLRAATKDIALDHMTHLQEFHVPIVM